VDGHELYISDAKDDEARSEGGAKHYVHVAELPRCKGGPVPGMNKMFWLDTVAWQDNQGNQHQAHHLFFIALSDAGRDQWLELLIERGVHRVAYSTTHDDNKVHCSGCNREHAPDQTPVCEGKHPLVRRILAQAQKSDCDSCSKVIEHVTHRCEVCDFDLCEDCYKDQKAKLHRQMMRDKARYERMVLQDHHEKELLQSHSLSRVNGTTEEQRRARDDVLDPGSKMAGRIQQARLAVKVIENSVDEQSSRLKAVTQPPPDMERQLKASISVMEQKLERVNAELHDLLQAADSQGLELDLHSTYGGKTNTIKSKSNASMLRSVSNMEDDAESAGSDSDMEDDDEEEVSLQLLEQTVSHELQVDLVVEADGVVCMQHGLSGRRLPVAQVSPQKALHVLSVSQTESKQVLVGSLHRSTRVGLRVRMAKGRDSDLKGLGGYRANLSRGGNGSIIHVSLDHKSCQVQWDVSGDVEWYLTGQVAEYGELGFQVVRKNLNFLEVSHIDVLAENMEGRRFSDSRELTLGVSHIRTHTCLAHVYTH
jgi:hypothetical protein